MKKLLSKEELYTMNTISVKVKKQDRKYNQTLGEAVVKKIQRTRYLKLCWMCGEPYESHKRNSFACQVRCSLNIVRYRKNGLNPPANMERLTKEKHVTDIMERFGYK